MVSLIKKLVTATRTGGIGHLVALGRKNVVFHYRLWLDRRFDRQHGTDTSGRVELTALSVVGGNKESGVYYESTPTKLFHFFLRNTSIDYSDFTFVDLGSGKGRCLLLASNYPFKRVIGVEFSRELHETATRNIARYRSPTQKCQQVESVMQDAGEYHFPDGHLYVYAYNPFDDQLMSAVLSRLTRAIEERPRKVVLLYYNPRPWIMRQFDQLLLRARLAVPWDMTREIQRPASIYANFELPRGTGWMRND